MLEKIRQTIINILKKLLGTVKLDWNIECIIKDENGKEKFREKKHNIISISTLELLAKVLSGEFTSSVGINYCALGTNITPLVESSTQLGTEIYRNQPTSVARSGKSVNVVAFFDQGETSGTYTEFGNFLDGTATANSGLACSLLNVNWTKAVNDTMTINQSYTLKNN